jgi:diaminopimelate decarboxylase
MVDEGLWIDVAGGGEIVTALAAGADPATLVLHGNAKTTEEIQLAVEAGVGSVVVDNFDDIDRLEAVLPRGVEQGCLVRVIPGVQASTHAAHATGHEGSKFGLAPPAAREAIARIEASDQLRMDGLHTHVGSQIMVAEELAAAVEPLAALGHFSVYDLGGGLGARYTYTDHPPSLDHYLDVLIDAARAHLPGAARILIEPGRSMVASSAVTIYTVTTVKGDPAFVAVDGGMGDNLEVALVGQRFEATIANRVGGGQPVTVVGRHCESGDVLSENVPLRDAAVGDLLAVPATGAYCYTMSNNYNGARRIPVVFVADGQSRLVVRRETWPDLLSRDVV